MKVKKFCSLSTISFVSGDALYNKSIVISKKMHMVLTKAFISNVGLVAFPETDVELQCLVFNSQSFYTCEKQVGMVL